MSFDLQNVCKKKLYPFNFIFVMLASIGHEKIPTWTNWEKKFVKMLLLADIKGQDFQKKIMLFFSCSIMSSIFKNILNYLYNIKAIASATRQSAYLSFLEQG